MAMLIIMMMMMMMMMKSFETVASSRRMPYFLCFNYKLNLSLFVVFSLKVTIRFDLSLTIHFNVLEVTDDTIVYPLQIVKDS